MADTLIIILSQFGLPGLVILGLAYGLYLQSKEFQAERRLWHEERKAHSEEIEKYLETSIEIIQANTKALAELTMLIGHGHHEQVYSQNRHFQNREIQSRAEAR